MRKIKYFILTYSIFLFFAPIIVGAETEYSVWIENSLCKIKRDTTFSSYFHPSNFRAQVKAARNEYEAFQVVLNSKHWELKNIKIFVTDLEGKKGNFIKKENIEIFLEHYIYISKFTTSPGWYPDALIPFKTLDIKPYAVQPIWVSIYIPPQTIAGEYEGLITIEPSNAESFTIVLKVTVWDFTLPTTPYLRTSFCIYSGFIAEKQNIPKQSLQLKNMVKKYNENALEHRISPTNPISPHIIEKNGKISINFDDFDIEMQHYLDLGLNSFNVSWHQFPYSAKKVSSQPLDNEKVFSKTREILRITENHLRNKGWLDLSYIYLIDEPRKEYFPQVKDIFWFVKECAPGIRRLLTLEYWAWQGISKPAYKKLVGYVDIWTILTSFHHEKFLKERQKANDEVWWYISCGSKHPYANFYAIDYPAIDHRIVFWQAWRYNITGFLYWAINLWKVNVWENPVSFPGTNGDGFLIYWSEDGPINSIRWEIIRDGIEDYDYLSILRERMEELQAKDCNSKYKFLITEAKNVCDVSDLVPNLTNYTKDPSQIINRREKIANLILRINRILENL